jgi:phosphate transport system substrate-binding protein
MAMRTLFHGVLAVATTALLTTCLSTAEAGEKISIAGSSTVKPVVEKAVKSFKTQHPDVDFVVGGGGSGHGVKSAGKGEVQIGMASRNIKDKETAQFPDLKPVKIGIDGIAIVVNKKNPINSITSDQVRDIFTGKITNWKDLGGEDAPIALISTNSHHGTFDAFCKGFELSGSESGRTLSFAPKGGGPSGDVTAKAVDGNKAVLAGIMTQPTGISYASLGAALSMAAKGAPIKVLSLDGVAANEQSVVSGAYPVQRSLLLITNGDPEGPAAEFIEWMTGSDGQQIVKELEFIPVN